MGYRTRPYQCQICGLGRSAAIFARLSKISIKPFSHFAFASRFSASSSGFSTKNGFPTTTFFLGRAGRWDGKRRLVNRVGKCDVRSCFLVLLFSGCHLGHQISRIIHPLVYSFCTLSSTPAPATTFRIWRSNVSSSFFLFSGLTTSTNLVLIKDKVYFVWCGVLSKDCDDDEKTRRNARNGKSKF